MLYIGPGAQLNVHQDTNTTFLGTLVTSGTFSKSGAGTLEVAGPSVMILGGPVTVSDGGTLRLRTAGGAMVASGAVAQVNASATLELAGSVSNLSSATGPPIRAAVVNNSAAVAGLLVSGANQRVGGIDGSGNTVVAEGASLTADHIVQTALVIGGTAASPASVTISASDSGGNPVDRPGGPLAGAASFSSLWPSDVFATLGGSTALLSATGTTSTQAGSGSPLPAFGDSASLAGASLGTSVMRGELVPEPTGWALAGLGIVPFLGALYKKRRG
jgi:hypothetical protein